MTQLIKHIVDYVAIFLLFAVPFSLTVLPWAIGITTMFKMLVGAN